VSDLCKDNDILFILDEVITGFGRTGSMFAADHYGVRPDLLTFAKGVTSGYAPVWGVLVGPRICQPFYLDDPATPIFRYGATYAGHATASAVAVRNLDILEEEALVPRVKQLATQMNEELHELADRRPSVTEVRAGGFIGGVALSDDVDAVEVVDELIDLGFISRPLRGNTLQLSPPFITTNDELHAFIAAIDHVLAEMESA
jgi:adenosylmethionine-8-amino-7-oxononanoate aminotransferase